VGALDAQADPGIVSGSTIERKKMSTKTIYKRIALVAVAALGAGVLSVVPANASQAAITGIAVGKLTETPTGTALTAGNRTASTLVSVDGISAFNVTAGATVSLDVRAIEEILVGSAGVYKATLRGVKVLVAAQDPGAVAAGATKLLNAFTAPTTVGTYTIDVVYDADADFETAADQTSTSVSMTVLAAPAYSAALSTMHSVLGNGTAAATAADNSTPLIGAANAGSTNIGAITITLRNALNAEIASGLVLTAVMSGSGGFGTTALDANTPGASACGTVARVKTLAADAVNTLVLCADGTSGVGTVTVSVTDSLGVTTVLGTKTMVTYGTVATLSATVLQGIATPGIANGDNSQNAATQATLALTPAVVVVAKDANGVIVPGLTVTGTPADLTIIAGTATTGTGVTGTTDKNGPGHYNFNLTGGAAANVGKSTTIVYSTIIPASGTVPAKTISAAPVTVSLGGTPATVTWALDKTSYAPGEKVTITVTAKDAAGNNAADGTYANLFGETTTLGGQISGSTPVASVELVGGKATYTAFAPGSSGNYVISNKLGTSVAAANVGKALTATIVVGASADMAAITTLINSLIAKINALNKLVIKIQKKVRA
jgi:hypothetical protein